MTSYSDGAQELPEIPSQRGSGLRNALTCTRLSLWLLSVSRGTLKVPTKRSTRSATAFSTRPPRSTRLAEAVSLQDSSRRD